MYRKKYEGQNKGKKYRISKKQGDVKYSVSKKFYSKEMF